MSKANDLTNNGYMSFHDAYHSCVSQGTKHKTKQGFLELMVITFDDKSFVEFAICGSGYWPHNS